MSASDAAAAPAAGGVLLYCGTTSWDIVGKRSPTDEQGVWSPQRIAPLGSSVLVRSIFSGPAALHCALVDTNGVFYAWGKNNCGQLGHGDGVSRGCPVVVDALKNVTIVQAACGRSHTMVLTDDGTVFSFGNNKMGQLGIGAQREKSLKPVKVAALEGVKQIGVGADFSAAITTDGSMYTWGCPENGALGHNTDGKFFITASKLTFDFQLAPVLVQEFVTKGAQIDRFSCGDQHTVAMDTKNRLWTWGFGGYGRLGHGEQKDELRPRHLEFFGERPKGRDPTPIRLISAGSSCCYVVTTAGRAYFWGRTKTTGEATMYPKPVNDLNGWNVHCISSGKTHTVVSADKALISWGPSPTNGELGYGHPDAGNPKSSTQPKLVDSMKDMGPFQVACGHSFTLLTVVPSSDEIKAKIDALPVLDPVDCPFGQGEADDDDAPSAGGGAGGAGAGGGGGGGKRKPAAASAPAKKGKKK